VAFGSNVIASAKTILEVDRGDFDRDLLRAYTNFHSTTGKMENDLQHMTSRQLRAARLQGEYNATVKRFGPESSQAIRALERLRSAEESVARSSGRSSVALRSEERSIGRMARGALAGSGAVRGLGRAVAFASTSFLGGVGLVYAIRSSINAAEEAQLVHAQLARTLKAVGLSYASNRKQIDDTIQAQSKMSAFLSEDLLRSFNAFVRRTGDVSQALRLNALAADIARARGMNLQSVTVLLTRAMNGNARAATTLGLPLRDVAAGHDKVSSAAKRQMVAESILNDATKRYAGQAQAYANSAAGAQDRFRKSLHDSEEIIGRALLPTITHLAQRFGNYLDKLNRTGQLQRNVNDALHQASDIASALEGAFKLLKDILGPLNRLLGGTANSVEALVLAFGAFKARKILLELGLIQAGVEGIGAASLTATGEVAGLRGALLSLPGKRIGLIAGVLAGFGAQIPGLPDALRITRGQDPFSPFNGPGGAPETKLNSAAKRLIRQAQSGSPAERKRLYDPDEHGRAVARRFGFNTPYDVVEAYWNHRISIKRLNEFANLYYGSGVSANDEGDARRAEVAANTRAAQQQQNRHRPPRRSPIVTQVPLRLELLLEQARLTKTETDDLAALRKIDAFIRKALADKRLKLKDRYALTQELVSVEDQIAALTDKHAKDRKKKGAKASPTGDRILPESIRLAIANAKLTKGEEDDLKALRRADAYLRKLLADKKLSLRRRREITDELSKVDKQIANIKKKDDTGHGGNQSEKMALLALRAGFFGEFAPNVFHPNGSGGLGFGSTHNKNITIHVTAPPDQPIGKTMHELRSRARYAL
jgi:hypothetical protein